MYICIVHSGTCLYGMYLQLSNESGCVIEGIERFVVPVIRTRWHLYNISRSDLVWYQNDPWNLLSESVLLSLPSRSCKHLFRIHHCNGPFLDLKSCSGCKGSIPTRASASTVFYGNFQLFIDDKPRLVSTRG